uniref:Zinc/iron permease n=1 Tax=Globisporangium ultimum (strain ATCC 200006 / CBS 805.95 / DAOM BR144) TaxID=431595 RepID=K3WVH3_GLOUD
MADEQTCCGCADLTSEDDYNTPLHIGAIFILFAVSAAGTLLPVVSKHVPALSSNSMIMEWLMTFGFGVVIATGFIHMMNEGIEMLSNPCLGQVVENYESLGLAVVLATVVVMHLIECESAVFFADKTQHLHGHAHGHAHGHVHDAPLSAANAVVITPNDEENPYHQEKLSANTSIETKNKKMLAAILFEVGVVFHSVIVGIDLGVTAGTEFKTLLAAMCFHQFFEGIAISGSAIGAMESLRNVLSMNFAFAITTPVGMAIGIAIRTTYSSTSTTALWVQGILNCVAGGILLYTGLVELLTYHMTTNNEFLGRSGKQRFLLYLACWLGAGAMALIGKWA